jgi:uncharacterized repeat protein (TIGR01451 family)
MNKQPTSLVPLDGAAPASKRRSVSLRALLVAAHLFAATFGAASLSPSTARADSAPGGTATEISGTVFHDFNSNGVMNTAGDDANPAVDVGMAGINVSAFAPGATTAVVSAVSSANGTYTLAGLVAGSVYRIEFSTLPADFEPSFSGVSGSGTVPSSGSSVQFAAAGTRNLSFGINRPCDYCQANPQIAINAFVPATTTNVNNWSTGVFPYFLSTDRDGNANGTNITWTTFTPPLVDTTQASPFNSTGNVYGLAWARNSKTLFSSAFYKLGVTYGPGGPGAIYKVTGAGTASPTTSLYVDLNSVFPGAAGTIAHNFSTTTVNGFTVIIADSASASEVGKESFGDIEVNKDESALYVVNLNDRKLYRIPTSGALNATTITSVAIPSITGCAADTRPFGLGKDGNERLHVGAVCSAETGGTLSAQVWRYDEIAGTFTSVYAGNPFAYEFWVAWQTPNTRQPQLADIQFDGNYMYLGIRDRWPDTAIPWQGIPPTQSYFKGKGDVLCTVLSGATYTLENNGSCGARTSTNTNTGVPDAGPGGKSFFWNDWAGDGHDEAFYGAVSQIPGATELLTSKMDASYLDSNGLKGDCGTPNPQRCSPNAGGVGRFDTATGDYTGAYDVYGKGHPAPNDIEPYYGRRVAKTSGIGDIETLCDPAPVQIGNRVWRDSNGNGIQDAGEPAIGGVTVTLMIGANSYTAVTDANGEYLFSSANIPNSASSTNNIPMTVGASFMLTINPNQAPLTNLQLTGSNAGGQTDNNAISDVRDNDASVVAGEAKINGTIGAAGQNNHGYDFGYTLPQNVSLGNRVWIDGNNNGVVDNSETNVAGVALTLYQDTNGDGFCNTGDTVVSTTVTSAAGYYNFVNLAPSTGATSAYYVVVDASNFNGTGALVGFTSSNGQTASGVDVTANDKDHGTPTCNAVASTPIQLTPGTQPTGEPNEGNDSTPDGNSNQTIDFGFYKPVGLGNFVWFDIDRDGQQDPGEAPVAGVTVTLSANGQVISTTTTDANGLYQFIGLTPGIPYTVCFTAPSGLAWTIPGTTPGSGTDSNVNPATGCAPAVTLAPNEFNPTIDAGLISPVTIEKLSATSGGVRNGVPVLGGDRIVTYTLAVRNTSAQPVANVVVSDALPSNLTYVAGSSVPAPASTNPLIWNIAAIGPNGAVTITFRTQVTSITGTIRNVANVVASSIIVAQDPADIQAQPTAVTLDRFSATALATGGVNVAWVTALELNSLGFDVYRAESADRSAAVKINAAMIAARSSAGSAYSFVDTGAKAGVAYSYWLLETELNGTVNTYGPATVGQVAPVAQPVINTGTTVQLATANVQVSLVSVQAASETQAVIETQAQSVVAINGAAIVIAAPVANAESQTVVAPVEPVAAVQQSVESAVNAPIAADVAAVAPVAAIAPQTVAQAKPAQTGTGVAVVDGQVSAVQVGAQAPAALALPVAETRAAAVQNAPTGRTSNTLGMSLLAMLGLSAVAGVGMLRRKRK